MSKHCLEREWKGLSDLAHSLKGSSAQLGAVKLSQVAAKLELLAKGDDPSVDTALSGVTELGKVADLTLVQFGLEALCARGTP
jgi:HPt (histidine-containing phosphotransfer) domain-containing protein